MKKLQKVAATSDVVKREKYSTADERALLELTPTITEPTWYEKLNPFVSNTTVLEEKNANGDVINRIEKTTGPGWGFLWGNEDKINGTEVPDGGLIHRAADGKMKVFNRQAMGNGEFRKYMAE